MKKCFVLLLVLIITALNLKTDEPQPIYLIPPYTNTGNNASIVIYVGDEIYENCEIGVWDSNNLLIGSGVVYNRRAGFAIWGDNSMTPIKDGASENELLTTRVYLVNSHMIVDLQLSNIRELTQQKDYNELRFKSNGVFTCNATLTTNNINEILQNSFSLKPNPFNDYIILTLPQNHTNKIQVNIYDALGKLISPSPKFYLTNTNEVIIKTENLDYGIYIINILVDNIFYNKIMVKND